jgi:hypothetical protein
MIVLTSVLHCAEQMNTYLLFYYSVIIKLKNINNYF